MPSQNADDSNNSSALLARSVRYFLAAINRNPADPRPWCGLGCALSSDDPLLTQHAFCRSLQLDKSSPHSWANLGLLYAEFQRLDSSEETVDALTQVADTPVVWIERAMLLERKRQGGSDDDKAVGGGGREEDLCRGADSYRAALRVGRHPAALIGFLLLLITLS